MNSTTTTLLCALPLSFAFAPASEKINLTPRYEAGTTYAITQSMEMNMDLDDLSVTVADEEQAEGGIEFGMDVAVSTVLSETVLEVRDGEIAKMNVTVEEMSVALTGEMNAMGSSETIDESPDSPSVGRTVEITIDEEGAISKKDVTEDVETPLSDAEAMQVPHNNHFGMFLPTEEVEEGVAFELSPDWDKIMKEVMASMDASEMGAEQAEMMGMIMDAMVEATAIEASGTVTKVEEGVATIDYEISVQTTIDDLMSLVKRAMPEAGELPPINAVLEMSMDMTGTGLFNLEAGQLNSLNFGGEFELSFSGDADVPGMGAADASAVMSGEFSMENSIEVQ